MLLRAISPTGSSCQRLHSYQPCLRCMAKVLFWHLVCGVVKEGNLLARTRESQMLSALHGARCGAVSRHPAQALHVRGRVPGGAAQSSSQLLSATPRCRMANAPVDAPHQPAHLHRVPAESPLDMLLRHPCFPLEIAAGMTARQPNSESLSAVFVAAMRRNSPCMGIIESFQLEKTSKIIKSNCCPGRLLSSGGDPTLRAPALPSPATKGMRFWRSRERLPGPVPLTGASRECLVLYLSWALLHHYSS